MSFFVIQSGTSYINNFVQGVSDTKIFIGMAWIGKYIIIYLSLVLPRAGLKLKNL